MALHAGRPYHARVPWFSANALLFGDDDTPADRGALEHPEHLIESDRDTGTPACDCEVCQQRRRELMGAHGPYDAPGRSRTAGRTGQRSKTSRR